MDRRDAPELRERAIRVLGDVNGGEAELRVLYAELERNDLKERTIRVVAETRSDSNAQWLEDIARDRDEPVSLRERAIRVLGDELHEVEALRDLYASETNVALKERIIRVVASDESDASDEWLGAIAEDRSERTALRERAIRVLGEREGTDAVLRSLYTRLDRPALKERTIRVVAESHTETNARWLETIARDQTEPKAPRERAIRVLGDDFRNVESLREIYQTLSDAALKERIIRVVGEDRAWHIWRPWLLDQ